MCALSSMQDSRCYFYCKIYVLSNLQFRKNTANIFEVAILHLGLYFTLTMDLLFVLYMNLFRNSFILSLYEL